MIEVDHCRVAYSDWESKEQEWMQTCTLAVLYNFNLGRRKMYRSHFGLACQSIIELGNESLAAKVSASATEQTRQG